VVSSRERCGRASVRRRCLLYEIEKAHPEVFDCGSRCSSDGRLHRRQGRTVDFLRNTVLIMTSNIRRLTNCFQTRLPAGVFLTA